MPAFIERATLDHAASIRPRAPFYGYGHVPLAPFPNAPVQSGAAIRPHTAFDQMTHLRVLLHGTNL